MLLGNTCTVDLVDNEEDLCRLRYFAQTADVCGVDAEWQPGCDARATVVQLAFQKGSVVRTLVLDLLKLDQRVSAEFITAILSQGSLLKVGYGLLQDIDAIDAALQIFPAMKRSEVQPVVDIQLLHRHLKLLCPGSIPQTSSGSLAGLVHAHTGEILDKTLQCSSWGDRPLSPEQVQYAALDAICLLHLLQSYVRLSLRPDSCSASGEVLGLGPEEPERTLSRSSLLTKEDVEAAVAAWSGSLEAMINQQPAAVATKAHLAFPQLKCRAGSLEGQDDDLYGLPVFIPWKDLRERDVRFLVDTAQEGLARQLRLCGFDAKSSPDLGKANRPAVYRYLVETAEDEGRVILTCDRLFTRRRLSHQTYLVRGLGKQAQLEEVMAAFGLTVDHCNLLSRCAKCNGDFVPRPLMLHELPPESAERIPARVVERHNSNFWMCRSCQHVYWRGSQFERCCNHLSARLRASCPLPLA